MAISLLIMYMGKGVGLKELNSRRLFQAGKKRKISKLCNVLSLQWRKLDFSGPACTLRKFAIQIGVLTNVAASPDTQRNDKK